MAGKYIKLSLWALDPSITLEDVSQFMHFDYNKTIKYLEDRDDVSHHDKTLFNRWKEYERGRGFDINNVEIHGVTYRHISALGCFELPDSESNSVYGNFIAPRRSRVFHHEVQVFFFEYMQRVYVILSGSVNKIDALRKNLMGGGRGLTEDQRRWRRIQIISIQNFNFSSEFFYWLISKGNDTIETDLMNVEVEDIRVLSQSGTLRNDVTHDSEGANILDEAPSRAGLGMNSGVRKLGTTLILENGQIKLIIHANGDCWIDNYSSSIGLNGGELAFFEENLEYGALTLYCRILPLLKESHHSDTTWTPTQQAQARKEWALGAINELCTQNEISLEQIRQIPWFII